MTNKKLSAILLTAMMIKAIVKGAQSPDPFNTVEIFLQDVEG